MKKVENTQSPSKELEALLRLYNFLEIKLNIQTRLIEIASSPAEVDYSDNRSHRGTHGGGTLQLPQ